MSETGKAVLPGTIDLSTGEALTNGSGKSPTFSESLDAMQIDPMISSDLDLSAHPSTPSDLLQQEVALQNRLGAWLDAFQCKPLQSEASSQVIETQHKLSSATNRAGY